MTKLLRLPYNYGLIDYHRLSRNDAVKTSIVSSIHFYRGDRWTEWLAEGCPGLTAQVLGGIEHGERLSVIS